MSNYIMHINLFGAEVRCETESRLVSINDLVVAGNRWRALNSLPQKNMQDLLSTSSFNDFKNAVAKKLGVPVDSLMHSVKGRNGRTMGHLFLAIYIAEQISPEFHVEVIQTFVEGKILEFRSLGGTEFKNLNGAIDVYLPGREEKDNKGIYIQVAKMLREKILGPEFNADDPWSKANADQTHLRYSYENRLVDLLRLGVVNDYAHLKTLIEKL